MRYRGLSRAIARVAYASKDRVAKGRHVRALMLNDDLSEQDRVVFTQVRAGPPSPPLPPIIIVLTPSPLVHSQPLALTALGRSIIRLQTVRVFGQ